MLAGEVAGSRLDRYVLPVDQPIPLDADGFLDASGAAWWGSRENRPQPAADLAGCRCGFVLLAAGGAGKSFVMNRLSEAEPFIAIFSAGQHRYSSPRKATSRSRAAALSGPPASRPQSSTPARFHVMLNATATAYVFKFCERNPKMIKAVAISCLGDTPDKINDPRRAAQPRLNGKLSDRN